MIGFHLRLYIFKTVNAAVRRIGQVSGITESLYQRRLTIIVYTNDLQLSWIHRYNAIRHVRSASVKNFKTYFFERDCKQSVYSY